MLRYLKENLGFEAKEKEWDVAEKMPLFLRSGRKYSVLSIEKTELLLIRMDAASFNLMAFQKQLTKLSEYWLGEIVLCFEKLTTYQRKALIEKRLSFIVPGSQLYLPPLGIALQERMAAERKKVSRLSANSQLLLLYLIYHGEDTHFTKIELSKRLNVSAMHITRAVQEVTSLGLVKVKKNGRSDNVTPVKSGKQLYEMARPYLVDPVQKRQFVKQNTAFSILPLSGEAALAERTMLNIPAVSCRAIGRKEYKEYLGKGIELVDPAWYGETDYIELEIWKYDPELLTADGTVDVISLATALTNSSDERIQRAIDKMMEKYRW